MEAAKHPRQQERLEELHRYGVLDTERERDFDEVVELASEICGTAISVINLIDAERQWFKAETGLGVRETPLATSICSHVILENDFVEIPDTLEDPRMIDNPLCCGDPGLRFYAGALLRSESGLPLGTLCVLDWQPKQLTALQRKALQVLANQVMAQLDLRRALAEAQMLRKEVDHRVRNSLMSIAALARVSARAARSDEAREAITAMQTRISAVAEVHHQLYRANAGAQVDLADFVQQLADHLSQLLPDAVDLVTEVAPVRIGSEDAASLGLLINEFVANSVKHAFPDGRAGRITIDVAANPDGSVAVTLGDTGVGLRSAPEDAGGLGMKIAELACQQLDCSLEMTSGDGGVTGRAVFFPKA